MTRVSTVAMGRGAGGAFVRCGWGFGAEPTLQTFEEPLVSTGLAFDFVAVVALFELNQRITWCHIRVQGVEGPADVLPILLTTLHTLFLGAGDVENGHGFQMTAVAVVCFAVHDVGVWKQCV